MASIRDFKMIRERCQAAETALAGFDIMAGDEYLTSNKELLDIDPAPGIVRMEQIDADTRNNGAFSEINKGGFCPKDRIFTAELHYDRKKSEVHELDIEFHDPSFRNGTQLRHEKQGSIEHFSEKTFYLKTRLKDMEYAYNSSSGTITVIDHKTPKGYDNVDQD
ncbi:MAG: hypothetical protein AB2L14_25920 [Candidatus Xenobiia bacterium LiM19]